MIGRHGGILADDRECVVVPADFPGGPASAARKVADAGMMVTVAYFGARGELILATTDANGARVALGLDRDRSP